MFRLKFTKGSLAAVILFFVSLLLSGWLFMPAAAAGPPAVSYLAVGDSIAKGYSCDETVITPYPELVSSRLEQDTGKLVELNNIAKNGLSTMRFNASMLETLEVREHLQRADIITVTIGANDLIDEFKRASQEVLGRTERFWNISDAMEMLNTEMKSNPLLVFKAIGAIANWDYESFEENYCEMMDGIKKETKESVKIIVTDIYNPTIGLDMPVTLEKVVGSIIGKMNNIIRKHQEDYGYQIISLTDAGIGEYVQSDGLHPTQDGQQLIADEVLKELTKPERGKNEGENETAENRNLHSIQNATAIAGIGLTGVLLIVSGLWNGKKRRGENEDITGGN